MPTFRLTLRQKELLTSAFILLFTLGTLGAAEAALRLNQILSFGTTAAVEQSDKFQVDPETGLRRPVPGSVHGKIHYNSLGFRSPELVEPKPAGTLRVAFLGSSTTNDPYVLTLEDTWPAVAVQTLSERYPACRFDYLNAGAPGLSTRWLSVYYQQHIRQLQPDLVVILSNDQNVDLDRIAEGKGIYDGVHYRPSWLAEHSLFWGKMEKNTHVISLKRGALKEAGKLRFTDDELLETFEPRLQTLLDEVRQSGALPVLLNVEGQIRTGQTPAVQVAAAESALFYMPYMSVGGLIRARDLYNGAIDRVADHQGILRIDPRGVVPGDPAHFTDTAHFNNAGSRLMGSFVGDRLAAAPAVQALLHRPGGCLAPGG